MKQKECGRNIPSDYPAAKNAVHTMAPCKSKQIAVVSIQFFSPFDGLSRNLRMVCHPYALSYEYPNVSSGRNSFHNAAGYRYTSASSQTWALVLRPRPSPHNAQEQEQEQQAAAAAAAAQHAQRDDDWADDDGSPPQQQQQWQRQKVRW